MWLKIKLWIKVSKLGTLPFPPRRFHTIKEALSVLMLCTPVFIFTSSRAALLGHPRCGLPIIWLLLLAIFNTLVWEHEKKCQNTKILGVHHFCMIWKWLATVTRRAKHQYWESVEENLFRSGNMTGSIWFCLPIHVYCAISYAWWLFFIFIYFYYIYVYLQD